MSFNKPIMKALLVGKLLIIVMAFCIYNNIIKIGDVPLLAKEKDAADSKSPDTPKSTDSNGDETKPDGPKADGQRKSFLSDLFTLPKLNAKTAQKDEVGKYLDLAERKERQIDERTKQLAKREEQLKLLESALELKVDKIEEERKFIATTLQQEKDLKGERVDKLVELYEKMEPKKAAPTFEKLDKDLVVSLFKRLKQKQVTNILELMNPDKSAELTEYFARVKSEKEYDLLKELNESLHKEFQDCKGMPMASNDKGKTDAKSDANTDAKTDSKTDVKADSKTTKK